ncbi:MAG: ATP synthase F0 subunit A [Bdellovibrionaceae bacterium]|nr:ATP synthase F0 subunit A [Pseudobdellovibrionaceae bacterium]|tara:strand:- start:116025 stop:116711 length:687 start_codon:yes stop_codon:yes gene_type:complete
MVHFNWTQLIPSVGHHYIHVATLIAATGLLIGLSILGRMALGSGESAILPAGKLNLKGFLEVVTEFIASLTVMVMGEDGRRYSPMFATIFFYIFFNNVLGLIPGMTPATDNINTTVGLGLFVFVVYNIEGVKEHGISYLKQFLGPVMWLAWLMVLIELVSHIVRPISLGLRLKGNMMGDHAVLGVFLELVPVVPIVFYFLGLFVCFMQAFVFTMLTMIYVSMAISHDH